MDKKRERDLFFWRDPLFTRFSFWLMYAMIFLAIFVVVDIPPMLWVLCVFFPAFACYLFSQWTFRSKVKFDRYYIQAKLELWLESLKSGRDSTT